ncbi:Abi family protein [Enterococcus wangshanyuanii]|uniref:CAAX amino protease n=1 Tax=Enterococcus wangshanyuanii TaxID=2005703 RepID=A0ABQ1PIN9_9ENTE|nr:Abi family protein [Enterococcus wangshanyuanii]GGC97897.1 CAAX amino protease [Enterococcus wangshanyuanii]
MASISDNLDTTSKDLLRTSVETKKQKDFKNAHPKMTPKQLIQKMEKKGIKFDIMSKDEAEKRIKENTYYFKVGVYRYNFDKDQNGKYKNLDFAYLDDLAIIDMRFRRILLNMSLDLEHSLKTLLNSVIVEDKSEDGYTIVQDFADRFKMDLSQIYGASKNKLHYLKPINDKHSECTSIWVLFELMTFGDMSKFLEFFFERTTIFKMRFKYPARLIKYAKNVRNAAAHNNPVLINMRGNKISPDSKIKQVGNKAGISPEIYRNRRVNDILCLFFLHDMYCSVGVKNHLINELEDFSKRCRKNATYYKDNAHYSIFRKTTKPFKVCKPLHIRVLSCP